MTVYGETAADRGLDVIIAGAGGKSADLPNMTASIAYPIPSLECQFRRNLSTA
jgi:Phosphoribosylcarboxyaminoimidazole (NCAIR) mutase